MISRVEIVLNIIHYLIYRLDYRLHMLSNKVNPLLLLGHIPAVKRKFKEQGTTQKDVVNKVWTDERFGFGIMISGAALVIFIFCVIFPVSLIINSIVACHDVPWRYLFFFAGGLSYLLCHCLVFKNDKYLVYFNRFSKWSMNEKCKYALFGFSFFLGAMALFIYSFRVLPLR